ncbi:hypothetical protein HDV05_001629 [Chytridiales sp. JEL 0842]|nr:hypothetical protein HDV05_001629 [Chytridiales sp. JEL 0842]
MHQHSASSNGGVVYIPNTALNNQTTLPGFNSMKYLPQLSRLPSPGQTSTDDESIISNNARTKRSRKSNLSSDVSSSFSTTSSDDEYAHDSYTKPTKKARTPKKGNNTYTEGPSHDDDMDSPSTMDTTENINDPEELKRLKALERNRKAAQKCRQKKKMWVQELEAKTIEAEQQNADLRLLIGQLKEEMAMLRSQMLLHHGCNCKAVQSYRVTAGQNHHH